MYQVRVEIQEEFDDYMVAACPMITCATLVQAQEAVPQMINEAFLAIARQQIALIDAQLAEMREFVEQATEGGD